MSDSISLFFQTLTPEILDPNDFVNWERIHDQMHPLRREIALLDALDKRRPVEDLADLIHIHPKMLKVLQLLVAHRPDRIIFRDERSCNFRSDIESVAKDKTRAIEIAEMFNEMGLPLFLSHVKSVADVIKGVLVGLEPNRRKNARGSKMEDLVSIAIEQSISDIVKNTGRSVEYQKQMTIKLPPDNKKIDNLILLDGEVKIAVETNFYSSSGSKPSETLGRAYPDVQTQLRRQGIEFIVITDGEAWHKMKPVITRAFTSLACILNLKQAYSGELTKAIERALRI